MSDQAANLSQGTVFPDIHELPVVNSRGVTQGVRTEHGVVVMTQTCDALRSEYLQVCRIERGLSQADAESATKGRITRYVPLPDYAADAFADLTTLATVSREWLSSQSSVGGPTADDDQRRLRQGVGRRFARVARPDEVTGWLKPLQVKARRQAGHPERELNWAFERIWQIRVASSSGWRGPTYSLVVTFIMHDDVLPQFTEGDLPVLPTDLERWICGKTPAQIEARLKELSGSDGQLLAGEYQDSAASRYYLWEALGEALLEMCRQGSSGAQQVLDAESRVATADEFTLRDFWESEQLDLDHLSDRESEDGQSEGR